MGLEIDFLAVGQGESSGDAIALRYGNLTGPRSAQTVVVIDGGYADSGETLVQHVQNYYGTSDVDVVVSTHPDRDHISGLTVVVEKLNVANLLMHRPWNHSGTLQKGLRSGFQTLGVNEKLEKSLTNAADLESLAIAKRINIVEPFTGVATDDGCFRVLGPSPEYYEDLLGTVSSPASPLQKMLAALRAGGEAVRRALISESLTNETLRDDGVTTANNNTSVISMLTVDGHTCLLTGDAGIPALEHAATVLEGEGFVPGTLNFAQIPHHGSRRNVGPSVLDRLLGSKGSTSTRGVAFVSAPQENPEAKHPAKKVTNAFIRRGYTVHATQGQSKWHHVGASPRTGYSASVPLEFHYQVEEDSDA